jgi:hypothetical protein
MRETSIECLRAILASGFIGLREKQIYQVLYELGPLTAGESFREFKKVYEHCKGDSSNNVSSILNRLRHKTVVIEVGTRNCQVTGRRCILWDVTKNYPVKPIPPKSKDQIIRELKEEIKQLKMRLITEAQIEDCSNRQQKPRLINSGTIERQSYLIL